VCSGSQVERKGRIVQRGVRRVKSGTGDYEFDDVTLIIVILVITDAMVLR
jgi:hypothetical protein